MGSNTPCVGEDLTLFARPAGMVSYHWEGQKFLNETTDVYQLIIPNADLAWLVFIMLQLLTNMVVLQVLKQK